MTKGRRAWLGGVIAIAVSSSLADETRADVTGSALAPAPPLPNQAGSAKPKAGKPATDHARAEIIVLHATNDKKGIDPKIGKLPELGKPPFSSYDSYKLLDRAEVDLTKAKAERRKLPDDGQLEVTLNEIAQPAKVGEPIRFGVGATILKPGGKTFLPGVTVSAKKGEIFFVAGQKYAKGILVIGIRMLG